MGVSDMVASAKARVENLTVDQVAAELQSSDVVLVDVREPAELAGDGVIPGSIHAPRGMLEFHADPDSPYHMEALRPDKRVILYCKSGSRSALAAATLTDMGYPRVGHLDGGIVAWTEAHRPVDGRQPVGSSA